MAETLSGGCEVYEAGWLLVGCRIGEGREGSVEKGVVGEGKGGHGCGES